MKSDALLRSSGSRIVHVWKNEPDLKYEVPSYCVANFSEHIVKIKKFGSESPDRDPQKQN